MPTGRAFIKHEFDEAIAIQQRSAKDPGRDAAVAMKSVRKPSADQLARLLADLAVRDPAT